MTIAVPHSCFCIPLNSFHISRNTMPYSSHFNFDPLKCPVLSHRCKLNCSYEATLENCLYVFLIYTYVDVWLSSASSATAYNCNAQLTWPFRGFTLPFSLLPRPSFFSSSLLLIPAFLSFILLFLFSPPPLCWCNLLEEKLGG